MFPISGNKHLNTVYSLMYGRCYNMRVKIDMSEDLRERVREWANRNGYQMKRAYAELIKIGLKEDRT